MELFCIAEKKRCHSDEHSACIALGIAVRRFFLDSEFRGRNNHGIPRRVYECKFCNYWHLTSQEKRNESS